MARTLDGCPNLSEVIAYARELGVSVEHKHRTGELYFKHPSFRRPVLINSRRKDTPRAVLVELRRLAALAGATVTP